MKSLRVLRAGFHRAAIPFHLQGLTGPGGPHHLEILRRRDTGQGPPLSIFCFMVSGW